MHPGDPAGVEAALKTWDAANPVRATCVPKVAEHSDHLKKTIGVEHIGLGGDYDGMDSAPVGMEDVSGYPALFVELAKRGYSQDELEKIASGNMLRVLKAVEENGRATCRDRGWQSDKISLGDVTLKKKKKKHN